MPPFLMSLLGAAGSALNGGQQMIRSAVSRVVSLMANTFMSGIRLMFNSIVGVFRAGANTVTNLATSLFKGTFGLMKAGLVGLAAAVGGMVVSIKHAVDTVKKMGNELNDLRASGFSTGSAGAIQRNFRAFGLNPNFGNLTPEALSARAGAWGLPDVSSSNFIPALAAKYKSSDPYMREYLLSNFEMNTPEARRMMMMSQSDLNGQAAFQNRVYSNLNIDPEAVAGLSQKTELLTQRMAILKDAVFLKLADVVLPRLLAVGERVVGVVGDNSDKIGTLIDNAFEKVNAVIVNVATIILKIPEAMFALADSVLNFAEVAIKAIPLVWDLFLSGVAFVQDALGNLIGLAQNGFSHLTGLAEMMGASFVGAGETVMQVWGAIEGPMQGVFDHILQFLSKIAEAAPAIVQVLGILGKVPAATGEMTENMVKRLGGTDSQGALGWLLGGAAGGLALKKAPGMLWNAGKALFGFGGGSAAGGAAGAAGNPGTWARLLTSPGGRGATWLLKTVLNPLGLGGLFEVGAGAATGAATAGAGGAAAGAARGGFSAAAGRITNHPLVKAILAGGALGLIGYNDLQQRGWLPGSPASLSQIGQYTWDNTIGGWFGGGGGAASAPGKRGSKVPANPFSSILGGTSRMGAIPGMFMGAMGGFNTNPMQSSWALGLDERYGGQIRGFSDNALGRIGDIRRQLDGMRNKYDAEALLSELRKIGGKLDDQTKYAKEIAQNTSGIDDRAAGYAMWRYAKESSAALRRQS